MTSVPVPMPVSPTTINRGFLTEGKHDTSAASLSAESRPRLFVVLPPSSYVLSLYLLRSLRASRMKRDRETRSAACLCLSLHF